MWGGMLPELLYMIARKYIVFYEDYLTFTRVCKSWHLAAAASVQGDYSNGLPSRFPSLLLAEKEKDGMEFRELFLLSNKSVRKIRLPESYGKVYGSSCGWLLTVGSDDATQLINPLSRETINLPKVDTFTGLVGNSRLFGVKKLLIVSNTLSSLALPVVVVIWGIYREIGFCRPGDKMWTAIRGYMTMGIHDITYYNGQVYGFDTHKYIRACDVYGENPTALVHVSKLPSDLFDKALEEAVLTNKSMGRVYITGLDESKKKKLLVVIRHGRLSSHTCKITGFLLFAYDLEDKRWSRVNDLGKKTLFVGQSSSFWIEDTTGVIKRNCIYYTEDDDFVYNFSYQGGGKDMGIYHLSDKTIEPHFTGESRNLLNPPFWLQSV